MKFIARRSGSAPRASAINSITTLRAKLQFLLEIVVERVDPPVVTFDQPDRREAGRQADRHEVVATKAVARTAAKSRLPGEASPNGGPRSHG